jgi:hypothetical protein
VKVEMANRHIERVHRLGRIRGDRPILVSFTSFSKKLEVLQAKRNESENSGGFQHQGKGNPQTTNPIYDKRKK